MFPGFIEIPTLDGVWINRDGKVIDLNRNVCPLPVVGTHGYYYVNCLGRSRPIHRLLGMAFIPLCGDFDEFVINHKNGNKLDITLENLEWVTHSDNLNHAFDNNLRTDNDPVLVKNIRTNEVHEFRSIGECARAFGVNPAVIHWQLKSRNFGRVSWGTYLFIKKGSDWPEVDVSTIENRNGYPKQVFAYQKGQTKPVLFRSIGKFAEMLGCSSALVYKHVKRDPTGYLKGWRIELRECEPRHRLPTDYTLANSQATVKLNSL